MMITLYNTKSKTKEKFQPLNSQDIGVYVCGPTVYDRIHVGNARSLVTFDLLHRLLKSVYPKVTYVQNITDVDDKINARAQQRKISIQELTQENIIFYHEDAQALGILKPTIEPKATDHIGDMINLISLLLNNGSAYLSEGHILFSTQSFPEYGMLAHQDLNLLKTGARIQVESYKKDPLDFVLWKPSDHPAWESPWGLGRPGWHIECTAMAQKYLGLNFDIHGGGCDLIFPHHQNELAQAQCAHPKSIFSRYWMHNGYLTISDEKMSKSLGNSLTVKDLREEFSGKALRWYLLQTHYRQPLAFKKNLCAKAMDSLLNLRYALHSCPCFSEDIPPSVPTDFWHALADDLNTPAAFAVLFEHVKALRLSPSTESIGHIVGMMNLLGFSVTNTPTIDTNTIEKLIAQRQEEKAKNNFTEADAIRKTLKKHNIMLYDTPDRQTIWLSL